MNLRMFASTASSGLPDSSGRNCSSNSSTSPPERAPARIPVELSSGWGCSPARRASERRLVLQRRTALILWIHALRRRDNGDAPGTAHRPCRGGSRQANGATGMLPREHPAQTGCGRTRSGSWTKDGTAPPPAPLLPPDWTAEKRGTEEQDRQKAGGQKGFCEGTTRKRRSPRSLWSRASE